MPQKQNLAGSAHQMRELHAASYCVGTRRTRSTLIGLGHRRSCQIQLTTREQKRNKLRLRLEKIVCGERHFRKLAIEEIIDGNDYRRAHRRSNQFEVIHHALVIVSAIDTKKTDLSTGPRENICWLNVQRRCFKDLLIGK